MRPQFIVALESIKFLVMPKKESTLVNDILFSLFAAGEHLLLTFSAPPSQWRRRGLYGADSYRHAVYKLRKRGAVKVVEKNNKNFLALTEKGKLEALLAKAKLPVSGKWDGKWRLIIFDIPEDVRLQREQLRGLLKKNNFRKLQASVYVNPYPLNREAIRYLEQSGLMDYIRIIKVEEMDSDRDLKKKFGLQ